MQIRTRVCFLAVAIGIAAFTGVARPQSPAPEPHKKKARVTFTQRIEFRTGGLIQIVDSFGDVKVEGWDQPDVELTVVKSSQKEYLPKDLAGAIKALDGVKVEMQHIDESSLLVINTTFPARTPRRMMRGKSNLQLEYTIRVPRNSRLIIKHDIGEVSIANVNGDIQATNSIGELRLDLPETNKHAVDARVKIGDVSSEFGPETERQKLLSAKLDADPASSTRRLFLRVGIGDIQIAKLKTEPTSRQNR